jgi:hypothetical protein
MNHNFKRSSFSQISNLLISCGSALSMSEFRILCYIISNVESWQYSDERIAEAVGCSKPTAAKDLNSLSEKGLVTIVQRGDRFGKKTLLKFNGEAAVQSFIGNLVKTETRLVSKPGKNGNQVPGKNGNHKEEDILKNTDCLLKNKKVCNSIASVEPVETFTQLHTLSNQQEETVEPIEHVTQLHTLSNPQEESADVTSVVPTVHTVVDQNRHLEPSAPSDVKTEPRPTPMKSYDRLKDYVTAEEVLDYHYSLTGKPIEGRMSEEQLKFIDYAMGFSANSVMRLNAAAAYRLATGLDELTEYELKWFDRFRAMWDFGVKGGNPATARQRLKFLKDFALAKINEPTLSASIFLERILDPYAESRRVEKRAAKVIDGDLSTGGLFD